MKLRKLLIIIVALAVIALCGCGKKGNNSGDSSGNVISVVDGIPDDGLEWGELVPVE